MDATSARLERIGDELEAAARRDLPKRPLPRRLALAAVLLVILAPAAAFAGERLMSNDDVAQSMPAGRLSLAGTQPTCTTVTRDVEYHCALAQRSCAGSQRLEGNRRAHRRQDEARERRLPLAEQCRDRVGVLPRTDRVAQKIIGAGFLGEYAPSPGVG